MLGVRWGLGLAVDRYERRLASRDPAEAARRRTTLLFLRRVVVALVAVIAVWNVLSLYPETDQIVNALLASSAVVAIFVGLAFNTPLSNLGSGLLVAFAQPLRLGDRVTVGEHTGFVEEMDLLYTTLVTDEARRVFIPNSQLTSAMIVNRTIRDPRRIVSAEFPVRLGASLEEARATVIEAVDRLPGVRHGRVPRPRRRREERRCVAHRHRVRAARRGRRPARLGHACDGARRAREGRRPRGMTPPW